MISFFLKIRDTKKLVMKSKTKIVCILFIGIIGLGMVEKLSAQAKRKLEPADYNLWSAIYPGTLSNNGRWASYTLNYADKKDTLFLKNVLTKRAYSFPSGRNAVITKDNKWFGC